MDRPSLTVTTHDARRLEALLQVASVRSAPMAALLEQELSRATLVAPQDVPPHVVTMHSRVVCKDEASGGLHEVELVYPHEADADRGRLSILAPVGTALLGLAVGDAIDWPVPGGRVTRVRVMAVPFQPEAIRRLD
jgi:regulator of nucleoside diphosphate kinase